MHDHKRYVGYLGLVLACLGLGLPAPCRGDAVCRVKGDSKAAPGDGTSWDKAYADLQSALANTACNEIWVAVGTYKPSSGDGRGVTYSLRSGVALYGGFSGNESLRDKRDWKTNVTILSGDLNGNDNATITADEATRADNAYHVIYADSGVDASAILDGFTVTEGNANGGGNEAIGGGMNCEGSPNLRNVIFSRNTAAENSGGMDNAGSPTLVEVTFSGNVGKSGGGLANGGTGKPTLRNVSFIGNAALYFGGGLYNAGSLDLVNVTFAGNTAAFSGGGLFNNGPATLANVTFAGNTADTGGALYNDQYGVAALTHVTLSGNSATNTAGGIYTFAADTTLFNSLLASNTGGNCGGSVSAGADSLADDASCGGATVNATGIGLLPLAQNGGATQTMALGAGSAAIDTAAPSHCPATDQRGVARPRGARCDVGAYEK